VRHHALLLQEPVHDRAVDADADRAVARPGGTGDVPAPHELQQLELVDQPRAVATPDGVERPATEVDVPQRAVVQRQRRDPADDVQRIELVDERAVEALALRVALCPSVR
jgi:hypothetical protein